MNTILDNQKRAVLLEAALLEYIERYGLTRKASLAMRQSGPNIKGGKLRHISPHCRQIFAKFLHYIFS